MNKKLMIFFFWLLFIQNICAKSLLCNQYIKKNNIIKSSIYLFDDGNNKACFFAYKDFLKSSHLFFNKSYKYALWFGYYSFEDKRIHILQKPSNEFWRYTCHLDAVSFIDINGDGKRNISIIGSCDTINKYQNSYIFVYYKKGNQYILDENIYNDLFGYYSISIEDIKEYYKNPKQFIIKFYKTRANVAPDL